MVAASYRFDWRRHELFDARLCWHGERYSASNIAFRDYASGPAILGGHDQRGRAAGAQALKRDAYGNRRRNHWRWRRQNVTHQEREYRGLRSRRARILSHARQIESPCQLLVPLDENYRSVLCGSNFTRTKRSRGKVFRQ
jgi:hypothetical protein